MKYVPDITTDSLDVAAGSGLRGWLRAVPETRAERLLLVAYMRSECAGWPMYAVGNDDGRYKIETPHFENDWDAPRGSWLFGREREGLFRASVLVDDTADPDSWDWLGREPGFHLTFRVLVDPDDGEYTGGQGVLHAYWEMPDNPWASFAQSNWDFAPVLRIPDEIRREDSSLPEGIAR